MIEPQLSREAKIYRADFLKRIAAKSSEDTALVLAVIIKTSPKDNCVNGQQNVSVGATVEKIASRSMLNQATIRRQLDKLEFADLIRRKKADRTLLYEVTPEGRDILDYMVDEVGFPGRKAKLSAILHAAREKLAN